MGLEVSGIVIASSRALYHLTLYRKTQVALSYVFSIQCVRPDMSVFWVHANSAERFGQAYSSIAQECGIPDCDDPQADKLKLVKTWLENRDRSPWLMVIDSADDAELFFASQSDEGSVAGLGRFVPNCGHGSVLVTTRNKKSACKFTKGEDPIDVGVMSGNESYQLLHRLLGDISTPLGPT